MLEQYNDVMNQLFLEYQEGDRQQLLKSAKENYFQLTGKLHEESPYFETKMNAFNHWFVYSYQENNSQERVIDLFLNKKKSLDKEIVQTLQNTRYSLFEYLRNNLKGQVVFYDWLKREKVILDSSHKDLGFEKKDMLIARLAPFQDHHYCLPGFYVLPGDVKRLVRRQANLVRKQKVQMSEEDFLLKLESMKCKSLLYPHLGPTQIFTF